MSAKSEDERYASIKVLDLAMQTVLAVTVADNANRVLLVSDIRECVKLGKLNSN